MHLCLNLLIVLALSSHAMVQTGLSTFVTTGPGGFRIKSTNQTPLQYSFAMAGDFNNDNVDDFIVGIPSLAINGEDSGGSFIFLGGTITSEIDPLSFSSGSSGFRVIGGAAGDHAGETVGSAGDVNGDGFDDVLIGASGVDFLSRNDTGAVFVLFGRIGPYSDISLKSFVAGSLGFTVFGDVPGAALGSRGNSVHLKVWDTNDDDLEDFVVSTGRGRTTSAGTPAEIRAWIIYGKDASAPVVDVDLARLGSAGVLFRGEGAEASSTHRDDVPLPSHQGHHIFSTSGIPGLRRL